MHSPRAHPKSAWFPQKTLFAKPRGPIPQLGTVGFIAIDLKRLPLAAEVNMSNDRIPLRPSQLCRLGTLAPLACCIFALLLLLFSAPSLSAQTATGTISGHVSDSTGAVIPGAAILLTDEATGTVRSTVTTSAGDYTFPDVPPAVYSLQATHSGFNAAVTHHVELQVQQSLTQDFTLQVGAATQTVTVEAAGALLQTENSSLGTVVPTETISEMPLNGRNYLGLTTLAANANTLAPAEGQDESRLGGQRSEESISVGGSRIMFDHYTLDGVDNTEVDFNAFVVQPTIDAISEFKVQTGVYPAEFGYNATQVNVATKSGGNQYHGTAFEFLRNNYADALGYDYNVTPLPSVLPYKYNDYGYVIDGPLSIPHLFNGKNKLFFMANNEWYSQIQVADNFATLPTAAVLGGDFSGYTGETAGGPVIPIYDPATGNPTTGVGRTQFPGNVIPSNRINPESALILSEFYHPATTSAFTNNYSYTTNSTDDHNEFTVRGDYYQSAKSQFAFRFSNGKEIVSQPGFPAAGGTVGAGIDTNYYQYMGSNTYTISPTIVNVFTLGYTNFFNALGTISAGKLDEVAEINAGIPNLEPGSPLTWGIPNFSWLGEDYTAIGDNSDGPFDTSELDRSVNDNITLVKGKHSMDFGFQFDAQNFSEYGNQEERGNFDWEANATADVSSPGVLVPSTGSAFADFLLGDIYTSVYAVSVAQATYVRNAEAFYFDDNYKLKPNFSIQAGLRYELTPPWYSELGQEFIVDTQTNNTPLHPAYWNPTGTAPGEPAGSGASTQPENVWPIFMREGNCNNAYQGVNVQWVEGSTNDPTAPDTLVAPAPQCANGTFPNSLMETDYLNWAPRLGFSYSPTPTLVIRGGYGIFYEQDIGNARFDVARNLAGRITLGPTGNGIPGEYNLNWSNSVGPTAGPGVIAPISPPYAYSNMYSHRTEHTEIFDFDVQKQLGTNWSFEAAYMGDLDRNLYGFYNPNYSIPYGYLGNGAPTSIQARTPYPNYTVIQMVHDLGVGNYNAFSFKVTKRYNNGLSILANYTYAKSLDDTSGIRTQQSQLFPQNDLCITCEYGPSDFDVRNRVVGSMIYQLPVGQQPGALYRPSSKILDAVIGGWQYNVIGTLQGGYPFGITYDDNNADTNTIAGGTYPTRPNPTGASYFVSNRQVGSEAGHEWLNSGAFQEPAPGFVGSMGRNQVDTPGVENFDMALDKNFAMPYNEHHQLQIRFDAFNALNHTDFGRPNSNPDLGGFGQITGTNSSTNPRELQLAARYTF